MSSNSEVHELEPLTEETTVEIHEAYREEDQNSSERSVSTSENGILRVSNGFMGERHQVNHEDSLNLSEETNPKLYLAQCHCMRGGDLDKKTGSHEGHSDGSSICDHVEQCNNNILSQKEIFV